jgi:hypothetical protein
MTYLLHFTYSHAANAATLYADAGNHCQTSIQ